MALTPATTKQQIQYVVIPHPDDELSAWSLIQRSPADYPVFIVLTQGEQTQMGDGRGLQADRGEVIPQPQPFTGRGTPNLRGQRLSSWHGFLDAMSATDPTLDSPADVGSVPSPVGDFRLWIGAATARAVFDLGDGQVTPERVTAAIQAVRGVRARFGVARESGVVGAAYWNADRADALIGTHPDHRAVHVALWETHQGTPGPQWGRTAHSDPDASARGRTELIDLDVYEAAMGVDPPPIDPGTNPSAMRTGALQRWYGWLAFEAGGYWSASETDAGASNPFNRSQTFWQRF